MQTQAEAVLKMAKLIKNPVSLQAGENDFRETMAGKPIDRKMQGVLNRNCSARSFYWP